MQSRERDRDRERQRESSFKWKSIRVFMPAVYKTF